MKKSNFHLSSNNYIKPYQKIEFNSLSFTEVVIISIVIGTVFGALLGFVFCEEQFYNNRFRIYIDDCRGCYRVCKFNYITATLGFIVSSAVVYLFLNRKKDKPTNYTEETVPVKNHYTPKFKEQILQKLNSSEIEEVVKSLIQIIEQYKDRVLLTNPDNEDRIIFEFVDDIEYVNNQMIGFATSLSMNHKVNSGENIILNLQSFLKEKTSHRIESIYMYEDVYFMDMKEFIEEMITYCYIKINV